MREDLQNKVDRAVRLLQSYKKSEPIEVCYSGGKDSDVILELVKMAGIPYRAIYKNTTIDPPGTIKHAKEMGAEIVQPKISFLKLIEKKGLPTMRARFCCEKLKEYKILDSAVQGVRRSESTKRAQRYSEEDPIICRIYGAKKNHVNVFLPILSWTDEDVAEFIEEWQIQCHPLYYDEQGNFHVERRLGCIGCPLASAKRKGDYKQYPKLFYLVMKAASKWWDNHPQTSSHKKFECIHDLMFHDLFTNSYEDYRAKKYNLFGTLDTKELLEEYFNIKLDF